MVPIPIRGGQTSNELRLQLIYPTQHWSCWRPWGHPTQVQGSQKVDLPLPAQGSGPWKDVTPQLAQGSASPGVTGGGHTSTCPGTEFLGGQHALTCLGIRSPGAVMPQLAWGICILTQGHLALRLQQYWVG